MERDRKLRHARYGDIGEAVAGIRDKWEAASFRKWSRSSRGGKAGRDREFCRERNTATALAHTPTQCSNSFATGIQANGNANCSTADVIQLAETTPPAGIANYGIFWFDSTCHCPKVISNNGQAVQLGLLNVFNPDANTLEEYNGTNPQILR